MFVACAAFSAAIFTDEEIAGEKDDRWANVLGVVFGPKLKGKDRLTAHYRSYSPVHIVRDTGAEKL
jgi:hypothetical protein